MRLRRVTLFRVEGVNTSDMLPLVGKFDARLWAGLSPPGSTPLFIGCRCSRFLARHLFRLVKNPFAKGDDTGIRSRFLRIHEEIGEFGRDRDAKIEKPDKPQP